MGTRIEKTDSYVTDNYFIGKLNCCVINSITQEALAMKTVLHVLHCFKLLLSIINKRNKFEVTNCKNDTANRCLTVKHHLENYTDIHILLYYRPFY